METLRFPSVVILVKSTETPSPSIDTVVSSADIVFLIAGGAVSPGVIISPLVRMSASTVVRQVVPNAPSVSQVKPLSKIPVDNTVPVGRTWSSAKVVPVPNCGIVVFVVKSCIAAVKSVDGPKSTESPYVIVVAASNVTAPSKTVPSPNV